MWPWTDPKQHDYDADARIRKLETEVIALKLEWTELCDKLLHRLGRQAKRDRDAAGALEGRGDTNGPAPMIGVGPPNRADLYLRASRLRGR